MIEAKFVRSRLWLGILTVSCGALGAHDVEIVGCETGKIMASDADELDGFGERLSVHGDLAIVGAWNDEDNVDQLPGYGFGSAYIPRRIDGSWVEQQKLLPWDPIIDLRFGGDVAIHGTRAIVGATGADSYTGAVYFYHEIGGGWSGGERVQPAEAVPGDFVGTVVAIDVEVAVVGAPGDDTAGSGAGAAYILRNVGGQWSVEQKIVADDAEALDFFGWAVAIRGDTALISSRVDDDQGVSTGSVWVYRFLDGTWTQMQKLYASDADYGELFGDAVAMGEGVAVVSAIHHDSACPEDLLCNSGAAYVFRFEGGVWVEGSDERLVQIVLNLLRNARQAAGEDGSVRVEVRGHGDAAEIVVEDDGPGVPDALRERIFDPFFTTKGPDAGSGLGLAIAYDIARDHGGVLEECGEPGRGARFVLRLPRVPSQGEGART